MEVRALHKNARMSPQKVREVVRQIQGLNAQHAQAVLANVTRKSARLVGEVLKSAIANAENNHGLKGDSLIIKRAAANAGLTMKRFTPKARGSAGPILKRSTNIEIILVAQ